LLIIDYTNDFVAPGGALTCGAPAQLLEDAICQLAVHFLAAGDYVVFAVDRHQPEDQYHPESKLFPPHNLAGTPGRALYGLLDGLYNKNKDNPLVYWLDKSRYSAFAGTDLFLRLRERDIGELHLAGVCTDICVLHTAVDAYNLGFGLVVHEDCVASFDQAGHLWALGHFRNALGARVE